MIPFPLRAALELVALTNLGLTLEVLLTPHLVATYSIELVRYGRIRARVRTNESRDISKALLNRDHKGSGVGLFSRNKLRCYSNCVSYIVWAEFSTVGDSAHCKSRFGTDRGRFDAAEAKVVSRFKACWGKDRLSLSRLEAILW